MITVYKPDETDFSKNGLGAIDNNIIDPMVSETLNGMYMFTFKYPIFAPKGNYMKGEYILKAHTPKGSQLFRIHKEEPSMGYTMITAYHIFYDLIYNWIDDTNVVGKSGAAAGTQILAATNYLHSFEFVSDIATVESARIVAMNGVQAFLDNSKDNTFISRWGGEIDRNNFQIRMLREVGEDRHVTIEYRKDLLQYTSSIDWSTVITRIKPVGFNGLELPEVFVDSPLINNYPYPKVGKIEYKDIKAAVGEYADDEDAIQLEDAYAELRRLAGLEYSQAEIDRPTATYTVEFAPLMDTEEYKQYSALQTIYIGDTVKVKHTEEGIDLTAKVISYEYNPLTKGYSKITLGSVQQTLSGTTFKNLQSQIDDIKQVELSNLELSIDRATGLLNTALGGNVVKRNGELLIMNTDDVTTATQVWRWNLNGLGYSGTGYAGPYRTAITIDGHFVADFIDVGALNAGIITTGTVTGLNMDMNLDSGILNFTDPVSGNVLILNQGEIYFQNGTNTRHLRYSSEGFIIEPGSENAGTSLNTSLIMKGGFGSHKYVDFIDKDDTTGINRARIAAVGELIRMHVGGGGVEIRDNVELDGTDELAPIKASYFVTGGTNPSHRYEDRWETPRDGSRSLVISPNGTGKLMIATPDLGAYYPIWASDFVVVSSETFKTNIEPMAELAMPKVKTLEVVEYDLLTDEGTVDPLREKQVGFIAENSPQIATPDGKAINLYKTLALNVQAVQELEAELVSTKQELADLKALLIEKGVI